MSMTPVAGTHPVFVTVSVYSIVSPGWGTCVGSPSTFPIFVTVRNGALQGHVAGSNVIAAVEVESLRSRGGAPPEGGTDWKCRAVTVQLAEVAVVPQSVCSFRTSSDACEETSWVFGPTCPGTGTGIPPMTSALTSLLAVN